MPQGTIKSYDESKRSGVILDDGRKELRFDATSLEGSGLRLLRLGQRVAFELDGEHVRGLHILTLH